MLISNYSVFLIFLTIGSLLAADLLQNSDFEHPHNIAPWVCKDCQASVVNTSYHGHRSLKVTNRHRIQSGLTQFFNVQGGKNLKCRAYIKLLNLPHGKMSVSVKMMSAISTHGRLHHSVIGLNKYVQPQYGWTEIGGDIFIPAGTSRIQISTQVDNPSVNYLLDYSSCQYIEHDPNWKTKANQKINNLRKGSLNISLAISQPSSTNGLTVQIKQTKSKFAFGTAIKAPYVTDSTYKAYQDFVYNNFEWAVTENALKWRLMEWTKNHINYAKGVDAVKVLKAHGMKVRGHNMFWGTTGHSPSWLDGMSSTELLQQMHTRVNGMISHTNGLLEHWDVNNENLHGDYFEQKTGHLNITMEMFNWIHSLEPSVKLFLNDFGVVNSNLYTTAYKSQGRRFKDSGVPIYGMGVQSHFKTSHLDMDVLKKDPDFQIYASSKRQTWKQEIQSKRRNSIGIPMGTNCGPLLTDFFLYSYERASQEEKKKLALSFNFNRYIDDVISLKKSKTGDYVTCIYPIEFEIKDTTDTVKAASYRYLHLGITMMYRLDKIAENGFPMWITELSILDSNAVDKATALDDVMTLYFSHPAVEGVLLWGFWDGAVFDKTIALATGNNVTPNAAGTKWMELFHQRFRTNESHTFDGSTSIRTRVFLGEHQLVIKQNGNIIHTETINLDHGGKTATVHLQGSGSSVQVSHVAFG